MKSKDSFIESFKFIRTLGSGSFARVCLVQNKDSEAYYAMKILIMSDIIRLKQVEHVKEEKNILLEIRYPFIIDLFTYRRDNICIYMLLEYVPGDFFVYLRHAKYFTNDISNFYSVEVILALEYLHAQSIAYRDLKPENILLDKDGHLKLTDFGFAKKVRYRTYTLCGTPEYIAPELIQSKGHNKAVDWWALGILIYEMLVGHTPFYCGYHYGIYENILRGKIKWPMHLDALARDLIKKLLVSDKTKRLGNMKNGVEDIKSHKWFRKVDWPNVVYKRLQAPIIPNVMYGDDTNQDDCAQMKWLLNKPLEESQLNLFHDF